MSAFTVTVRPRTDAVGSPAKGSAGRAAMSSTPPVAPSGAAMSSTPPVGPATFSAAQR